MNEGYFFSLSWLWVSDNSWENIFQRLRIKRKEFRPQGILRIELKIVRPWKNVMCDFSFSLFSSHSFFWVASSSSHLSDSEAVFLGKLNPGEKREKSSFPSTFSLALARTFLLSLFPGLVFFMDLFFVRFSLTLGLTFACSPLFFSPSPEFVDLVRVLGYVLQIQALEPVKHVCCY